MKRVHQDTLGTLVAHVQESDANYLNRLAEQVVVEVGLEPTRTVKYGRF